MTANLPLKKRLLAISIVSSFSALSGTAMAQDDNEQKKVTKDKYESIEVTGRSVSYANNSSTESMKLQQSGMTSALASVDNLPGVLINEGDPFGSDEWSTSISMRGFQLDLESQQIGMTMDGIPNGNSNYAGGTKANRFVDSENLATSEVSQGTADIASRSHEALGGTINFTSIDPALDERLTISSTLGEYNAQKLYARYDTGEVAKDTFAWISLSSQQNDDYMDGSATNTRDHIAAKVISRINETDVVGYISHDDAREYTYQRVYGLAQYEQNPEWDGLLADWTGNPYQDQAWRQGWGTARENTLAYLKAEREFDDIIISANTYYHKNEGRGIWIPYYMADVTDDGEGNAHSELDGSTTVYGGGYSDLIYFVNRDGQSLSPVEGCQSSIAYPYGGGGAEVDGDCYEQGAIPVSSRRHTHYQKERYGFNADFVWNTMLGDMPNVVRAGIWYEDYTRDMARDWHKTIDAATGPRFENTPYWVQYDRKFLVETLMYYAEDELDAGFAKFRLGVKQFKVDLEKDDQIDAVNDISVSSDSDVLLSVGVVAPIPAVRGLEAFAGYTENYAAIKDVILEDNNNDVSNVEPETADNIDVGLRYSSPGFNASLTYYDIRFENRITFFSVAEVDGIDFLESTEGAYINVGGIDSQGIEASVDYAITDSLSVYGSYTYNDSTYNGDVQNAGSENSIAGNRVLGSAKEMAVVSFDYSHDDYFAGISTKYVGPRYLNQANSQRTDSYIISDFYIGKTVYDLGPGVDSLEMRLTVNNLFDEDYLGSIAPNAGWIGAPRIAALNVKLAF